MICNPGSLDSSFLFRDSGFNVDAADAAGDELARLPAGEGDGVSGVAAIFRLQEEVGAILLGVAQVAVAAAYHGVHVALVAVVRGEGIVVAVEENASAGQEPGIHAHAFASAGLHEDETLPGGAAAVHGRLLALEKLFAYFKCGEQVLAGEAGLEGGGIGVHQGDVFKFILAGRNDGGVTVDFVGIEQIEDGKMLHGEDAVEADEAQPSFRIQKVGNVRLLEAGLARQLQAAELPGTDAPQQELTQVFLQVEKIHGAPREPVPPRRRWRHPANIL